MASAVDAYADLEEPLGSFMFAIPYLFFLPHQYSIETQDMTEMNIKFDSL